MNHTENKANQLKKDGWLLIKNFFDEEFCDKMREACVKANSEGITGVDLLSNRYLSHVFTNEKFIKLIAELIGDKPVYFGDSGYQIASVEGRISNGFHKDSVDRKNPNGPDWGSDYSLIRVGIYLQDHKNYSEGLVVRTDSHKTTDLNTGKKVNVPSQMGDLIVWYLTTSHSGNAKRMKWLNYPVLMGDYTGGWLAHRLYYHLPKIFIKPSQKDRVAVFATFGKNDAHLKRYLNYLKHREYMVDMWKKINFDKSALEKIKQQNLLEVIDMKEEADQITKENFEEYNFEHFGKFNI